MAEFKLHQSVLVDGKFQGIIVGFATHITVFNHARPIVLVELLNGFYDQQHETYISVMAVHPDNLTIITGDNHEEET